MTIKNGNGKNLVLWITIGSIVAGIAIGWGALTTQQATLIDKVLDLDKKKVDKAIYQIEIGHIGQALNRIETKIDKMQEKQEKRDAK